MKRFVYFVLFLVLATSGYATINISVINPPNFDGVGVTKNEFFNVTVNVSCISGGGNCGDVDVYLDPIGDHYPFQDIFPSSYNGPYSWNYMMGYEFQVPSTKYVVELCKYGASDKWVYLYDASYTVLASQEITGVSNAWNCEELATPIELSSGVDYFVIEKVASNYGYYKSSASLPQTSSDGIEIQSSCYQSGTSFTSCNRITSSSYGLPDVGLVDSIGFSLPDNGKNLINTTIGATPFYTNGSNPRSVTLNDGESETVVFYVNATGDLYSTYEFFAYVNASGEMNVTDLWDVTIIPEEYSSNVTLEFENSSIHSWEVPIKTKWEVPIGINTTNAKANISVYVVKKGDTFDYTKPVKIFYGVTPNTDYSMEFITTYGNMSVASATKKEQVHFDNKTGVLDSEKSSVDYSAPVAMPMYNETGGVIQGAYYFDGDDATDKYLEQYDTSWFFDRIDFTACAWVNYYGKYDTTSWYHLSGQYWGNHLGSDAGNQYIRGINNDYYLNMDDTGSSSSIQPEKFTWQWACWTWDLNVASKFYLNGELVFEGGGNPDAVNDDKSYYSVVGRSNRAFGTPATNIYWNGSVDELNYWYNDVLSESEIKSIYTFGETDYCMEIVVNYIGGSEKSSLYCFSKDLTDPIVNRHSLWGVQSNPVLINFSASDNTNISLNISINGVENYATNKNATEQNVAYDVNLPFGEYLFEATACDQVDRCTTLSKTVQVSPIQNVWIYAPTSTLELSYYSEGLEIIRRLFV